MKVIAGRALCLAGILSLTGCSVAGSSNLSRLSDEQKRLLAYHLPAELKPAAAYSVLHGSDGVMPLPHAKPEASLRWNLDGHSLSLDDYLGRQPVTALLIAKDGVIVFERYQFGNGPDKLWASNSMAKSVASLAIGLAAAEGKLQLDANAQTYLPVLAHSGYGQVTLANLMRMGSGMHFFEASQPGDDLSRFSDLVRTVGIMRAIPSFNRREVPQGTRFNYAGIEPAILSGVLRAATGQNAASFLNERLWQAMGAEHDAGWQQDPAGLTLTHCCLFATPRDYLRLGILLANDGKRPDTGQQVLPANYLRSQTDWHAAPPPFRPHAGHDGYGGLFWLMSGEHRRFILQGSYGQAIFIDPEYKLVMVHLAVNATPHKDGTTMEHEVRALWSSVVQNYGPW